MEIYSPNKNLVVKFDSDSSGMWYEVYRNDEMVISKSYISFLFESGIFDGKNLECNMIITKMIDEDLKWDFGQQITIKNTYTKGSIILNELNKRALTISVDFRVYDDALAFNYIFASSNDYEELLLLDENTTFNVCNANYAWVTKTAQGEYIKKTVKEGFKDAERPLLISCGDYNTVILEAMQIDYPRMKLESINGMIKTSISSKPLYCFKEEEVLRDVSESEIPKGSFKLPFETPFRVIAFANEDKDLFLHNDLTYKLSEECQLEDISWIEPGKVIREVTLTTKGAKACVDFAKKHKLEYIEFDAGWYGDEYDFESDAIFVSIDPKRYVGELDLNKAIEYAHDNGIKVILYINHRVMVNQLDEVLDTFKKWGVDGIKYGFVEVGTLRWTRFLTEAIRKAANKGFVLTIHDEFRQTGIERMYPNLLTCEGVRGDEEIQPAYHCLISMYIRGLLAGSDNTVCYFNSRVDNYSSHGFQLAKSLAIFSPLMFLYWYDRPMGSLAKDREGDEGVISEVEELEFFDELPTVFDESIWLDGKVSEYAVIARRKDQKWFFAIMNANKKREFDISFSFLGDGIYNARIFYDDNDNPSRTHVTKKKIQISGTESLNFKVLKDQGVVMIISK